MGTQDSQHCYFSIHPILTPRSPHGPSPASPHLPLPSPPSAQCCPTFGKPASPAPNTFSFTWLGGSEGGDRARKGSHQDNDDYSKHAPGGLVG